MCGAARQEEVAANYLYHFASTYQIWLMALYDKDEASDLTARERKALKASIESELAARAANGLGGHGDGKEKHFRRTDGRCGSDEEPREGKVTLRTYKIDVAPLPKVDSKFLRDTRKTALLKSRIRPQTAHQRKNPGEMGQGRAKPNPQAAALVLLVRKYRTRWRDWTNWREDRMGIPALLFSV